MILEYLFFPDDGWGAELFSSKDGMVTIRAWTSNIVITEHNASREVHSDESTDENDHTFPFDQCYDVDKDIVVVQVIIVNRLKGNSDT